MGKKIFSGAAIFILILLFLAVVPRLFSEEATVLGKVGDRVITQKDLDELMRKYSQARKDKPFTSEEKKEILDNLVKGYLIIMEAEKEKVDERPDFKERLKTFRDELLMNEYISLKLKPSISVTNGDLEKILKDNPNLLPKESLQLQEIQVKTEKEADEIYEELKNAGDKISQKFSMIAGKKSIATTSTSGGNMRPVFQGQLPKELEEVAFSLKKGEFSKPIKTDKGFYILHLVERKERTPEEIKNLEDKIKVKLRQIEEQRKLSALLENKAKELREKTKVEIYYDRIQ